MDESIPKLGFLTTMDEMLMSSYITVFLMALQTFVLLNLSRNGFNAAAEQTDWWCGLLTPIFYCFLQAFHAVRAMLDRQRKREVAETLKGIETSLNVDNAMAVAAVATKNFATVEKEGSQVQPITREMQSRASLRQRRPHHQQATEITTQTRTATGDNSSKSNYAV